ncbi:MAG: hypothetical protein ACI91B_004451, partial [Planctomycetota bacterium]
SLHGGSGCLDVLFCCLSATGAVPKSVWRRRAECWICPVTQLPAGNGVHEFDLLSK